MNRTMRAEQYATNSNEAVITVEVNTDEPEWLCMNCEEGYTSDETRTECICKCWRYVSIHSLLGVAQICNRSSDS